MTPQLGRKLSSVLYIGKENVNKAQGHWHIKAVITKCFSCGNDERYVPCTATITVEKAPWIIITTLKYIDLFSGQYAHGRQYHSSHSFNSFIQNSVAHSSTEGFGEQSREEVAGNLLFAARQPQL